MLSGPDSSLASQNWGSVKVGRLLLASDILVRRLQWFSDWLTRTSNTKVFFKDVYLIIKKGINDSMWVFQGRSPQWHKIEQVLKIDIGVCSLLGMNLAIYLPVCLSVIYLYIYLPIYLSGRPSIHHLSIWRIHHIPLNWLLPNYLSLLQAPSTKQRICSTTVVHSAVGVEETCSIQKQKVHWQTEGQKLKTIYQPISLLWNRTDININYRKTLDCK